MATNEYLSDQHPGKEAMLKNDLSMLFFFSSIHPCLLPRGTGRFSLLAHLLFLPYCKQIIFGFVSQNEMLIFGEMYSTSRVRDIQLGVTILHIFMHSA